MKIVETNFASDLKKEKKNYINKPFVSLIVPAYNEASIVTENLLKIDEYMKSFENEYRWELILINDGSNDDTGELAEAFASNRKNIRVYHHTVNLNIGQTLRDAFQLCRGDYIVTLDVDLSYSPEYIGKLLAKIRTTGAKIVIASPYMKGGKVSNVPWLRKKLSVWANRFLSVISRGNLRTLTCMVRAYDRQFLTSLDLKAVGMEINLEIIHKTMVLRGQIEEIPAHLDWSFQKNGRIKRRSSFRIARGIIHYLLSGFIFSPFMFFMIPGILLLIPTAYTLIWALIHINVEYGSIPETAKPFDKVLSYAVSEAFKKSPHTFLVGGISLIISIQLTCLGIVSYQIKRYFDEIFHLCTGIYKQAQKK